MYSISTYISISFFLGIIIVGILHKYQNHTIKLSVGRTAVVNDPKHIFLGHFFSKKIAFSVSAHIGRIYSMQIQIYL